MVILILIRVYTCVYVASYVAIHIMSYVLILDEYAIAIHYLPHHLFLKVF